MSKGPQALVGGQAVIEGVMMRAPGGVATAVRRPDGGISVRYDEHTPWVKRFLPLRLPILRGGVTLIESLALGTGALGYSAEESSREEDKPDRRPGLRDKIAMGAVMAFSFIAGLALFFYLPILLTDLTGVRNGFAWNLVDGFFRLVVFFTYIWLITRWSEMRRVFQYHGAEHMTIFNYEAEVPITVENSRDRPRLHPRCGTSFLFFVMIVSIFVFALLGRPEDLGDRFLRIAFVPVIAGISYEVIRLSAKHLESRVGRALAAPGMGLQLLTTAQPDDTQIEVAVVALKAALTGRIPEEATQPAVAAGPERA